MTTEFDLSLRVLSSDHKIFVLRPGEDFRLYGEMVRSNAVMLDLPSLTADFVRGFPEDEELAKRIARARSLRNWHIKKRPADSEPSRDLDDYENRIKSNSVAQLKSITNGLFRDAKKGDLIVVPPKAYNDDAYVGELTDKSGTSKELLTNNYLKDSLPARRVVWLATIPKRKLPSSIIQTLTKPNVLFQVERSLYSFFYELAYQNFSIDNDAFTCRFDATSADFTSKDDFILQAFFNFGAYNTSVINKSKSTAPKLKNLYEAAFAESDNDLFLRTNINSPGSLSLSSQNVTPIIVATLLAIACAMTPEAAVKAAQNGTLVIGNSKAPNDACSLVVEKSVVAHLKLLGLDKWPAACERARAAVANSGLQNPVVKK